MVSKKYYLMNRDYYLQYQKDLYNKNKEEFKERARNRYNNLSPAEKQKRIEYSRNRYVNLPEDVKNKVREKARNKYHAMSYEVLQKHKEYQKNYQKIYRAKKKQELENIKKAQGNFDKNAGLTPPKT